MLSVGIIFLIRSIRITNLKQSLNVNILGEIKMELVNRGEHIA